MSVRAHKQVEPLKTLGLIAGMGELPVTIVSEAKKMGYRVVAIALQLGSESYRPPADEILMSSADDFHKIHIGRLGELIRLLKDLSITEAIMAGKVPKKLLYKHKRSMVPDLKAIKLLFSLENRSDDTIMRAIVKELEKEGIKLLRTTTFTKNLIAPEGVLTQKDPSKSEWEDIKFGWKIAKKMGQLDIGQAVVVKDKAVMAVEAIEGTDETIKRGGDLAEHGAVVIKVSKPQQDMRFDVPVVGANTLHSMQKAKAKVLAVEAGKCIIINRENFKKEADRTGIIVVGVNFEMQNAKCKIKN